MGLPTEIKKLPYPKSVFFIVSNEFCERFNYYGMRTILSLYLTDILFYTESTAKVIYHVFTAMVYFFPIFGAMLADSWLGKFKTILYVSMIYAVGSIVLSLAAAPPLHFPASEISMVGLLLIAIGTGGIKPCVSAFGGDQFVLPQQELQLARYFSMFYFAINAGSLISTTITPILREDVHCFNQESCFSLAFAVPGVLMIISIIVFFAGKSLYKVREPEGNMVIKVSKCISHAIKTKWNNKNEKKEHWLDYAEEEYGHKLVNDVKATLKVLVLYIPLPVFWALFDQQGTGWTFQARRMDGNIGVYTILPDQMQVVNPLLILAFIPLFQYAIYPCLTKMRLVRSPLQRLVTGGLLAAVAFGISACIALALESTFPILPSAGNGQLRIYNGLPCDVGIQSANLNNGQQFIIPTLQNYTNVDISVTGNQSYSYTATGSCYSYSGNFELSEEKSIAYFLKNNESVYIIDDVSKQNNGYPKVRTLINENGLTDVKYLDGEGNVRWEGTSSNTELVGDLAPAKYQLKIGDNFTQEVELFLGGVYAVVGTFDIPKNTFNINVLEITKPNSIHMLWLIPQYIIITMGEIMFSITGLEFSYSQAPSSMKSVLQACWLLTTAFGNILVVIIESAEIFPLQSSQFFLYTGLMVLDMVIFALMAMKYKYVQKAESPEDLNLSPTNEKKGIENAAYTLDES